MCARQHLCLGLIRPARMMLASLLPFLLLVLLLLPQPGEAAAFRVDDSGTTVSTPVVPMRWRTLVPGRGSDNTAEGLVQVNLRLDLLPWLNQPVRLYMALAPAPLTQVLRASWRTQGKLLPGTVLSGQRTVVFEGRVTTAAMVETLELNMTADGRDLTAPQSLQFFFEIEPQ